MKCSGLADMDKGRNPRTEDQALHSEYYNRAMKAHMLTIQALWQLILPPLGVIMSDDEELLQEVCGIKDDFNRIEDLI